MIGRCLEIIASIWLAPKTFAGLFLLPAPDACAFLNTLCLVDRRALIGGIDSGPAPKPD